MGGGESWTFDDWESFLTTKFVLVGGRPTSGKVMFSFPFSESDFSKRRVGNDIPCQNEDFFGGGGAGALILWKIRSQASRAFSAGLLVLKSQSNRNKPKTHLSDEVTSVDEAVSQNCHRKGAKHFNVHLLETFPCVCVGSRETETDSGVLLYLCRMQVQRRCLSGG